MDNCQVTPSELKEILKVAISNNMNTLISGPPGIGKTEIVNSVCSALDIKMFVSHPALDDPTDYKGYPYVDKMGKAEFIPFGNLKTLIEYEDPAVYFMDDLGQAPGSVQAALMQLIRGGKINNKVIGNNITFIAATNRKEDKSGVTGLYDAMRGRFATHVELKVSVADWVPWAIHNQMPYQLTAFVQGHGIEALWDYKPTYDLTGYPNPRALAYIGAWINANLPRSLLLPVATGTCGYAWAQSFIGFLDIADKAINPNLIIQNPDQAPIPQEPDALYALCGSLASIAHDQNIGAIIKYTERLELPDNFNDRIPRKDYAVAIVKSCELYNKKICNTHDWISWHGRHAEMIFNTEINGM